MSSKVSIAVILSNNQRSNAVSKYVVAKLLCMTVSIVDVAVACVTDI